eukprot:gene9925-biopygen2541
MYGACDKSSPSDMPSTAPTLYPTSAPTARPSTPPTSSPILTTPTSHPSQGWENDHRAAGGGVTKVKEW